LGTAQNFTPGFNQVSAPFNISGPAFVIQFLSTAVAAIVPGNAVIPQLFDFTTNIGYNLPAVDYNPSTATSNISTQAFVTSALGITVGVGDSVAFGYFVTGSSSATVSFQGVYEIVM